MSATAGLQPLKDKGSNTKDDDSYIDNASMPSNSRDANSSGNMSNSKNIGKAM
jgi:hypothetical protein